jgi:hypothetical protein
MSVWISACVSAVVDPDLVDDPVQAIGVTAELFFETTSTLEPRRRVRARSTIVRAGEDAAVDREQRFA